MKSSVSFLHPIEPPTDEVPGQPLSNNSTIIAVIVIVLLLLLILVGICLYFYRRKYLKLKRSVPAVFFDSNGNGSIVNNSRAVTMPSRRMNPTYQIPHPDDEPQYHVIDNMQDSDDGKKLTIFKYSSLGRVLFPPLLLHCSEFLSITAKRRACFCQIFFPGKGPDDVRSNWLETLLSQQWKMSNKLSGCWSQVHTTRMRGCRMMMTFLLLNCRLYMRSHAIFNAHKRAQLHLSLRERVCRSVSGSTL